MTRWATSVARMLLRCETSRIRASASSALQPSACIRDALGLVDDRPRTGRVPQLIGDPARVAVVSDGADERATVGDQQFGELKLIGIHACGRTPSRVTA